MSTQRPLKPATDHTLSFAEYQFAVSENSDEVWTLTQGTALVVITTQDNKTPPRHHALLDIEAGQLFFLCQPQLPRYSIALFMREDCSFTSCGSISEVFEAPELCKKAKQWVARLQQLISERCQPAPADYLISIAQNMMLAPDMVFSATFPAEHTHGNWICLHRGEMHLANLSQATVHANTDALWLPVNDTLWFTVLRKSEISLTTTANVPVAFRFLGCYWLFHTLVVLHSKPDTSLSASRTWDKKKQEEKKQLQAGLSSLVTGQQNKPSTSRSMPLAQALNELQKKTGGLSDTRLNLTTQRLWNSNWNQSPIALASRCAKFS